MYLMSTNNRTYQYPLRRIGLCNFRMLSAGSAGNQIRIV